MISKTELRDYVAQCIAGVVSSEVLAKDDMFSEAHGFALAQSKADTLRGLPAHAVKTDKRIRTVKTWNSYCDNAFPRADGLYERVQRARGARLCYADFKSDTDHTLILGGYSIGNPRAILATAVADSNVKRGLDEKSKRDADASQEYHDITIPVTKTRGLMSRETAIEMLSGLPVSYDPAPEARQHGSGRPQDSDGLDKLEAPVNPRRHEAGEYTHQSAAQ